MNGSMIEVVAGLIMQQNKVLVARRASHKSFPRKWEFPGGKVHEVESHPEALQRELYEEFGIHTRVGDECCSVDHDYGDFMIRLTAFWAEYTDGMLKLEDHDRIAWVPVENLLRYDMTEADHPIRDALVQMFLNLE